jgi:hypothetical protein
LNQPWLVDCNLWRSVHLLLDSRHVIREEGNGLLTHTLLTSRTLMNVIRMIFLMNRWYFDEVVMDGKEEKRGGFGLIEVVIRALKPGESAKLQARDTASCKRERNRLLQRPQIVRNTFFIINIGIILLQIPSDQFGETVMLKMSESDVLSFRPSRWKVKKSQNAS